MKIAVFSTKSYDQEYFENYSIGNRYNFSFFETALNKDTASLTNGFDAVCIFVNDSVDKNTIEILSKNGVRLIALRCAGFNNVDIEAAKSNNIKVVRVPAYSPEAVAEHALALILTLNRKTHKAYNRVREGNFSLKNLIGFNLYGKTIGVIGTGQIGATFCRIIKGFGCKIIAFDVSKSDELIQQGVEYLSLDEVFQQSDILSLHCPLNPSTKHIVNEKSIALMKDGVMIINTSRGALINTADVVNGLTSKKIGYLGIDVYEQEEKLFFEDLSESIIEDDLILKLISFPNVLITSHQAYFTKEAMDEITTTTLQNIEAFDKHLELKNEVV
ncbi:2-hydroxyacid dehydrogenase [Salegentibacter salarius]|uniref:Hydroxyacid dehydrogenase n=1 Tax=Salegentibacter salarius TaxID=435906 RepID=A0A2N0U1G6_9FLAO|nr:2-hydroxyacid dehydrogenase [Salegentibacter salarius]OEY73648.1 hydroxyacid dehydrogenase [Salegentibacter salarius]PKD20819.1 hydroxyacid dehydrogenase [Salegentibacter salarius]SLJ95051.1 D-lactate dehydrogenase [Salegentibacter salarius]